eukprot:CAMPEP_0197899214 /NCGR_PEP_ID=MMETSP1439-20131203/45944_1 /TAXON_ID=66791 /ORGANISM="Gonyaulax spinifera, Strain CCMP409" /LENGTH=46 /DNA_ID= /DNA_START= /DNA_END= /DNA_ORIENTATION=
MPLTKLPGVKVSELPTLKAMLDQRRRQRAEATHVRVSVLCDIDEVS